MPGFDVEALRAVEFPLSSEWAYLDHAAVSPMPVRTARVMHERVSALQDPSLEHGQREAFAALARERVGALLNVQPAQIALLTNLGEAMSIVANGLEWRTGDEVVVPEQEFSSLVYPWLNLDRRGVTVVFVAKDGPSTTLNAIERAITARTRVVAVSHVEFLNGFRHDMVGLGELCRQRDVLLAVDATQSLGVLPADARAWQAGIVAAHGYKWMMAMHGIAALYVSAAVQDSIRPTVPGRSSVRGGFESLDFALDWHPDARRYQSGGPNWIGMAALGASLGIVEEIGIEAASKQAMDVANRVTEGVQQIGLEITSDMRSGHRSQIVSFTTGSREDDQHLVNHLKSRNIAVGLRAKGIRAAAHFWNTAGDADQLLSEIE
ncbi:aminotransferase class V-fold PLP-dependent enzyme [soil metagenome]